MDTNLKINYYGYFTPFGGYGIANLNWAKHLRRLGVDVNIHPKFVPHEDTPEWNILSAEEKDLFKQPFEKRRVGIIESNPFDFEYNQSDIKIANTMCESDKVSQDWPNKLNAMDHIIVPNEFCRQTFINSGVTKEITVIPHGVDTERFPYFQRPKRDIFTFGILGYLDSTDRKGAFDLIRAFASEFSPEEPVRLILKSSDPMFGFYSRFTDPRIKTDTRQLSFEEVNEFYQSIDCFVFPSKAEGVGYPPREAISTGLPTIVTNWSGLEDIAKPEFCYPLTPFKFEPRPNFIEQNGNWALIDIQELMYLMRYVYEHQEEAKQKGKQASELIGQFAWPVCAQKMKEYLERI